MTDTVIRIPSLQTERLILRAPAPRDYDAFCAFRRSPRSAGIGGPFPQDGAFTGFAALIGHWHLRGFGRWIVAGRDSDEPLGIVGPFFPDDWPEPEIAWSLFDGAEGRGIAQEAAIAARAFAYKVLGWTTAMSAIMAGNQRSVALAKRLGCTPEGSFEHPAFGTLEIWRHPFVQEAV